MYVDSLTELGGAARHALALLDPLVGRNDVTLIYRNPAEVHLPRIEQQFGVPLAVSRLQRVGCCWSVPRLSASYDVFINATYPEIFPGRAKTNVLVVLFPFRLDDFAGGIAARAARWEQRSRQRLGQWADALAPEIEATPFAEYCRSAGLAAAMRRGPAFVLRKIAWCRPNRLQLGFPALNSYQRILANSQYTAGWIERYYGRSSSINYPPVQTDQFVPGQKEKLILTVGRLQGGLWSKRQEILLSVFQSLYNAGMLSDWRMEICGYGKSDSTYLAGLREQARGYPVTISVDRPFDELAGLYGNASLYWHAMGLGQDAQAHPCSFEHFGLSTAEAMSASCIPMVFAGGGQTEIVCDSRAGFVWRNIDELAGNVRAFLAMSDEQRGQMRRAARSAVERFDQQNFYARTCAFYDELGIPRGDDCSSEQTMRKAA